MQSLIFALLCFADVTPVPRPLPKEVSTERADEILNSLATRMKSVESFRAKCTRTSVHPLTKKAAIFVGEIAYKKPNSLKFDFTHSDEVDKKDGDKTQLERMICDGNRLYEYSPRDKLILIHPIPKKHLLADHFAISLLQGLPPGDMKKRFEVKVLESDNGWYAHVRLIPKIAEDKKEATFIELAVLLKNPNPKGQPDLTYIPLRIYWIQPNGTSMTFLFSEVQPNAKLDDKTFAPPAIAGYRKQQVTELNIPIRTPSSPDRRP